MRLTIKLTLAITAAIVVVMVGLAGVAYHLLDDVMIADMVQDDWLIGRAMAAAEEQNWEDATKAQQLLAEINQHAPNLEVRLVNLRAKPNDSTFPTLALGDLATFHDDETSRHLAVQQGGYLYLYVPLHVDPTGTTALELRESLADRDVYRHTTLLTLAGTAVLMTLLSMLAAFGVGTRLIGRPIPALVNFAAAIGAGETDRRIVLRQRDEIGVLANAMNTMAEQIANAKTQLVAEAMARVSMVEQLRHADRLKTVGTLASGLAHEIGTPLNVIGGRAKWLLNDFPDDPRVQESARIIDEQASRINRLIRQVLDFARRHPSEKGPTEVRQLLTQAEHLLTSFATKGSATLKIIAPDAPLFAWVNRDQITQVLTNLIMNAVQAMPHGGRIQIGARPLRVTPPLDLGGSIGDYIEIAVEDEGVGIDPLQLQRIFEPFFTTKDVGLGTGLGLSIAYSILRENDGWFVVTSVLGQGSRFAFFVPATPTPRSSHL